MIHFSSVPEPPNFNSRVRVPGNAWLVANRNAKRPRDFWSPFKGDLATGFGDLCAYSALYEPSGTVDHFVSWDEDRSKAYEWDNYRFSSAWINSSKQNVHSSKLLDPFTVENGWFEIILPSLQLTVTDSVPSGLRARAEYTLKRLHLIHDERVLRQRSRWYDMYQCGDLTLNGLGKVAPLIAAAVRKAGLQPGPGKEMS